MAIHTTIETAISMRLNIRRTLLSSIADSKFFILSPVNRDPEGLS
jgi:predicted methyltransferase MtxX (methanogen marker protein 4)